MGDEAKRLESLIQWLATFEVKGRYGTAADLSDGRVIGQVLHQVASQHFTKEKLDKLVDAADNRRLKVSNLKKLKRGLLDFYLRELHLPAGNLAVPDENSIADGDVPSLCQLLELLLGCAVQCSDKETYITGIMSISDDGVKQQLMASIQQLLAITAANAAEDDSTEKNELQHQLQTLQGKYDELVEAHDQSTETIADLRAQLANASGATVDNSEQEQEVHQLRKQLRDAQDTLHHEQSEYQANIADLQKQLDVANRQLKIGQDELSDVSQLRDELEEARLAAAQVPKLESQIERLSKNVKQFSAVQEEAKQLTEQNREHVKRIFELENGQTQLLALEAQIQQYKSDKASLDAQLLEEQKRSDKLAFEASKAKKAVSELEKEKQSFLVEREDMSNRLNDMSGGETLSLGLGLDSSTPEMREKLIRLEAENEVLKAQAGGGSADDKMQRLQSLLDDTTARKVQLETENREQSLKILQLESDLEDNASSKGVKSTGDKVIEQLAKAERDLKQAKTQLDVLDAVKRELAETQQQLIDLKKEHSLVSLDQTSLVEKLKHDAEEEMKAKVESAVGDLDAKCKKLEADLTEAKDKLAVAQTQLSDLEAKHVTLTDEHDEQDKVLKEKIELVQKLLMEKDSLQSKCLKLSEDTALRLKEQEARFQESSQQIEERFKKQISGGGNNDVEVLQLRLQLTEIEKEHMAKMSEIQRNHLTESMQKDQAVTDLQHKTDELQAELNKKMDKIKALQTFKEEARAALKKKGDNKGGEEAISMLQNQLQEVTSKYEFEMSNRAKLKAQHELEQKMMTSAWYDLCVQYQRLASKDSERSSAKGNHGASFLARQRHAAVNRPGGGE